MAIGGWLINATIRFSSNGVAAMGQLSSATMRANTVLDGHTSKVQRMTQQLEAYRLKAIQTGAAVSGALAIGGAAFVVGGVKMAADLQRSLTGLNIATMNRDPQGMYKMVMGVSSMTAQNAITIANEAAMAASAGLNNPTYLQRAFPTIAKAADVANLGPKKLDPVETTKQLAQLSHLFGIFQGPQYTKMIDNAIKLMYVQPEGLSAMNRQGRLFIGQAMRGGVGMDQIFQALAIMGQQGFLQGRGGSGIGNFVQRMLGASTLTGHMSKAMHAAMVGMHMFNAEGQNRFVSYDAQGNQRFDMLGAIRYIGNLFATDPAMKRHGVQWLHDAFTTQGGNELSVLSRPTVQQKMAENVHSFNAIAGVEKQWEMLVKSNFWGQFSYALTNIGNDITLIWMPLLPGFTKMFGDLGDAASVVGNWLRENPGWAGSIGALAGALTTFATGAWVVFRVMLMRNAIMMPLAMARMSAAIDALTATASTDSAVMGTAGKTAAIGLNAVSSALSVLAVTASFWVGMAKNMSDAAQNPKLAKLINWANSGANSGQMPPGTAGTVDIFGRPLPGYHAPSQSTPHRRARSGGVTIHGPVSFVLPNVKNGQQFLAELANPLSTIFTSGSTRTHSNIPQAMTVGVV